VYTTSVEKGLGLRAGCEYSDQRSLLFLTKLQQLSHLELGRGPREYEEDVLVEMAQSLPRLRQLVVVERAPYERLDAKCPHLCVRSCVRRAPVEEYSIASFGL
jgi:hypothetical protein